MPPEECAVTVHDVETLPSPECDVVEKAATAAVLFFLVSAILLLAYAILNIIALTA